MECDHRALAIALFNGVWDLLEKANRSSAEDLAMIHRAHASLWHWLQAGTGAHAQRGTWMVARVYAELGWEETATRFLQEAARLAASHRALLEDWDIAFLKALEARIAAASGDMAGAARLHREAVAEGLGIADPDDRKIYFDQLESGAWHGFVPEE